MVMYGCESWTVKKAEYQRIAALELWCWRRLLRIPWTSRRSNPSILKEISPGCTLEGMMLKLKLQYVGHLMWRVDSLEKTLMLGGIGGWRRRGRQRMRWLDVSVNSRSWWWTGRPGVVRFMGSQRVGYDWATELNWTSHVKKIHPTLCYVMLQCLSVDGPTSHSMTMGLTMWLTVLYIHLRGFNILCALNWTLLPRSMKRKENMKIQQKEIFRCTLDYLTLN